MELLTDNSAPVSSSSRSDSELEKLFEARLEAIVTTVVQHYRLGVCFVAVKGAEGLRLLACRGTEQRSADFGSIADHWVPRNLPIIIENAQADRRFAADPLVAGPTGSRFYVGAPLMPGATGKCFGTLCLMDTRARPGFSLNDCEALMDAAREIAELRSQFCDSEGDIAHLRRSQPQQECTDGPSAALDLMGLEHAREPSLAGWQLHQSSSIRRLTAPDRKMTKCF